MTPLKIGHFDSITKITMDQRIFQCTRDTDTFGQWECDQEFQSKNDGIFHFAPGGNFMTLQNRLYWLWDEEEGELQMTIGFPNLKHAFMKLQGEVHYCVSCQGQRDFSSGGTTKRNFKAINNFAQFWSKKKSNTSWTRQFVSFRDN